jgi:RHS repeat-associated protein
LFNGTNDLNTGSNLYNGNITATTFANAKINNGATVGYSYVYDQLNRLKSMRQHDLTAITGSWNYAGASQDFKEDFSYDGNGNILTLQRNNQNGQAMDRLSYSYEHNDDEKLVNNKLLELQDAVGVVNRDDITGSIYTYDKIGSLTKDQTEGISNIDWTVYGKMRSVVKNSNTILYTYDAGGNRIGKLVKGVTTYYVRDALGNPIALYDKTNSNITWQEQNLYGSSMIGMWQPKVDLTTMSYTDINKIHQSTGTKRFMQVDYLGSNRALLSDNKIQNADGTYTADVIEAMNYYSHGMIMPGSLFSITNSAFRYGYTRHEKLDEINGKGNTVDMGNRMLFATIGRTPSQDPEKDKYVGISPFAYAINNPINAIDPDGRVVIFINGQHNGSGGQAEYWEGYDKKVMNTMEDHSARYVDGALGGWGNTFMKVLTNSNISLRVRKSAGEAQGMKDAGSIIANLTDGESIKIVAHSMGVAFARGYVRGIIRYATDHGLLEKVKFDEELDVNGFQGKDLPPSKYVKRTQNKTGGVDGYNPKGIITKGAAGSVLTVGKIPKSEDITDPLDADKGHPIGEMSTTRIPSIGNAGTESKRPIEQGNNNNNEKQ